MPKSTNFTLQKPLSKITFFIEKNSSVREPFPHSSHQADLAHHHSQKYLHLSFTNQSTFEKESSTATY
jgi:hypothetical protein